MKRKAKARKRKEETKCAGNSSRKETKDRGRQEKELVATETNRIQRNVRSKKLWRRIGKRRSNGR